MCPPDVDQTTRSPQLWHIIAPRVRKFYGLAGDGRKFHDLTFEDVLFKNNYSWDSWSKLAKPPKFSSTQTNNDIGLRNRPSELSRLESLPAELTTLILEDCLLEKSDIIALGLTSHTMWLHILVHVAKDCRRASPSLAGVEIACTGTYLEDLPEPFVKDGLAKSTVNINYGPRRMCEARKINWGAVTTYDEIGKDSEERWQAALDSRDSLAAGIPTTTWTSMVTEFMSKCSFLRGSSPDSSWVLRNLTTQEFVCCRPGSVARDRRGYVDHQSGVKLHIDDVLLLRICWTSSWTSRYEDWEDLGIYRGSWAGHCFDIVPRNQGDTIAVGSEWTDCTDELVEEALNVADKILPGGRSSLFAPSKSKAEVD